MEFEIINYSNYPGIATTTNAIHEFLKKTPIQDLVNWGLKNSL